MPDALYEADILEWSEQQAALLRRAAAGERVDGIDWENVVEEVESVGRSEWRACESLLFQALRHLLKCAAAPDDPAIAHWRGEIRTFLFQASRAFAPSMRQRIDLADLYREAADGLRAELAGRPAAPWPAECPFTLDALLARGADLDTLTAKLGPMSEHGDA